MTNELITRDELLALLKEYEARLADAEYVREKHESEPFNWFGMLDARAVSAAQKNVLAIKAALLEYDSGKR